MATEFTSIRLTRDRAEQVRALAERRGTTMTEALGALIQTAVDSGEIPATTAAYSVTREGDAVLVKLADMTSAKRLSVDQARQFAADLIAIADDEKLLLAMHRPAEHPFDVGRVARGIVIMTADGERAIKVNLTRDLGRGLAAALTAAADAAD